MVIPYSVIRVDVYSTFMWCFASIYEKNVFHCHKMEVCFRTRAINGVFNKTKDLCWLTLTVKSWAALNSHR